MIVQLWQADSVPKKIPDFVDPHICIDYDSSKKGIKPIYLFEVNPSHAVFAGSQNIEKTAGYLLKQLGFKKPRMYYEGEKPPELEQ